MTATRIRNRRLALAPRCAPAPALARRRKLFDRFKHYYTSIACWAAADMSPRPCAFGETFVPSPAPTPTLSRPRAHPLPRRRLPKPPALAPLPHPARLPHGVHRR